MPIKKYRVETDKGNFEVEVDEAYQADPGSVSATAGALARREVSDMSGTKTKGERVISDNPDKEPETWGGGFVKGLKDYYSGKLKGLRPALESAASPKTTGDFLQLLIPSEIEEIRKPASALAKAGAEGAAGQKGIAGRVRSFMGGMYENANPSPSGKPFSEPYRIDKRARAEVRAANRAAKRSPAKPSSIEEALGVEESPIRQDTVPDPTGDPSMTAVGDEARFNDTRETEALSGPRSPEKAVEELGQEVAKPSIESLLLGTSGPRITSLKADKMTPEMMQELRRYLGADKLSELTGLSPEQIRDLAPGPSRTPLSIEDQLMQGHDLFDHLP